jgi:hypothetical protein
MYRCAACDKPVLVTPDGLVRLCKHTKAAVIAELKAAMEGRGGLR